MFTPPCSTTSTVAGCGDLVEGRKEEQARQLLQELDATQRAGVKAVAMDIWSAYRKAVENLLPKADIVHDKFHLCAYLNKAVDTVRKDEHRQLARAGRQTPKGRKYCWLCNFPDLRRATCLPAALPPEPAHQKGLAAERSFWRILAVSLRRGRAEVFPRLAGPSHPQRAGADEKGRRDVRPPPARLAQLPQISHHGINFPVLANFGAMLPHSGTEYLCDGCPPQHNDRCAERAAEVDLQTSANEAG